MAKSYMITKLEKGGGRDVYATFAFTVDKATWTKDYTFERVLTADELDHVARLEMARYSWVDDAPLPAVALNTSVVIEQ